ncbi:uncharacterized protein LOC128243656 [Mya arenaria]|uniref:uncharacterized protein LOC128243656 n=1 Tax=Mya arenaria TaxID=6604 RepID=UPI0022E263AE|nr:uncharacterized protein LOC128243656 [Mya arenaria]
MAYMRRVEYGLKDTSRSVTVPADPAAKLMYYLDSMCTVLKLDDNSDINELRQFRNYSYLTHSDRNVLMHLCLLLKPDILLNKCIFQNDALCGNMANKFYDLEAVRNNLLVAGSVVIGGRTRQVTKIMTFKMSWLQANWSSPMQVLAARQEQERLQILRRQQTGQSCAIL